MNIERSTENPAAAVPVDASELVDTLLGRARGLRRDAGRFDELLASFRHICRWTNVADCERVVGQCYAIRRVRPDGTADNPCVARWGRAWVPLWGHPGSTLAQGMTVEQLM